MRNGLFIALLLLAVAAAVAVDRSLLRQADGLDRRIERLEAQLARSEAVRDSLDAVLTAKQDRLRRYAAREDSLGRVLAGLAAAQHRQSRIVATLDQQRATPDEHTPDALHRDLNDILRLLPPRAGTAGAPR